MQYIVLCFCGQIVHSHGSPKFLINIWQKVNLPIFSKLLKLQPFFPKILLSNLLMKIDQYPCNTFHSLQCYSKINLQQILFFFTSNCVLSPQLYGFRTKYSTESTISSIYDDMICNKEIKLIVCTVS